MLPRSLEGALLAGFLLSGAAGPSAIAATAENPSQNGSFDSTHLPAGTVSLADGWRVHRGDDPAFASPTYDDGKWTRTSLAADAQSLEAGMRWYRLRVKLPATQEPLALLLSGPAGDFEVYANGTRIPGKEIRSLWHVYRDHESMVELGDLGSEVQLAIRVYYDPLLVNVYGFSLDNVQLGSPRAIETERNLSQQKRISLYYSSAAIDLGAVLVGIGALILLSLRPSSREFLWLGLYLILTAVNWAIFIGIMEGVFAPFMNIFADPLTYIILVFQIEFTYAFAEKRITRAWRVFEWILLPFVPVSVFALLGFGLTNLYLIAETLLVLPVAVILPVILLRWFLGGNREAGWLIIASLLPSLAVAVTNVGTFASFFGWDKLIFLSRPVQLGLIGFNFGDVANLFFLLSIGLFMLLRFIRVSREQARGAAELEAAREVQQHLVTAPPATPGFRIESVYLPATQVGGDFYRVMPGKSGEVLVIVGDESGKGLRAAMTVSAIIGSLRTITADDPAEILCGLNRTLYGNLPNGFVTCLAAQLRPDGTCIVANAGHLSPYCNGEEIAVSPGLPLGIAPAADYTKTMLRLAPGDTLTFLSDGVVEARNPSGELFGFERAAGISTQTAQGIAHAAQHFGQEDDITVLTLTRLSVPETAAAPLQHPPLTASLA